MANKIVLGLGSNIGCRLSHIRQAVEAIEENPYLIVTAVSSIYRSQALLPEAHLSEWQSPFLNMAICCQSEMAPLELLAEIKAIEKQLGRQPSKRWAPRVIDVDILAWGAENFYHPLLEIPHPQLLNRAFALTPLLEVMPDWRHPKYPDRQLSADQIDDQQTEKTMLRLDSPKLVGILNVTPDSFSDGGCYQDTEAALPQVQKMLQQGAEIIDIGAESTRPNNNQLLNSEQEWQRLEPVLDAIKHHLMNNDYLFQPKISVDSRHYQTFERVIKKYPINWCNDIDGKDYQQIANLLKGTDVKYVAMHHVGIPPSGERFVAGDAIDHVKVFAKKRILQLIDEGLCHDQIIFDVGIGFGKDIAQYKQLFQNITVFQSLDVPVLVGHSRKSFMNRINATLPLQRDLETSVLSVLLAQQGVDYLRVHDVDSNQRALKLLDWYQ